MGLRVIICGGGTGGHVFPAIAIANALKTIDQEIQILFVGARGKMEMEKVPAAGYKIEGLWISGLQRKLSLRNLAFPLKLTSSLIRARSILKKFRPQVVVGVGGYSSGPVVYLASGKKSIKTLIQEQNSYAGMTNKLLGKRVDRICVAYENMERFFPAEKIIKTGNPVRREISNSEITREESIQFFNLEPSKKTMLVIGGSLGARSINESISDGIDRIKKAGIQLVWQTGKHFIDQARQRVGNDKEITVTEFIDKMDMAYAAADLVVSRAGAIAVSELCLVKKPVILVPYPFAAEDHQVQNALALVEKKAAIMVKDHNAKQVLVDQILELAGNEKEMTELASNIGALAVSDSAERIAQEIMDLVEPELKKAN